MSTIAIQVYENTKSLLDSLHNNSSVTYTVLEMIVACLIKMTIEIHWP